VSPTIRPGRSQAQRELRPPKRGRLAGSAGASPSHGRDEAWQNAEAELYFEAGRRPEALERFQELAERNVPGPALGRVRQLADKSDAWPARFPTVESIEAAWDTVRSGRGEPDARAIQSLIEKSLKGDILVPAYDSCHTSLWAAIDRHLRERGVGSTLRSAQEKAAQGWVRDARQARDAEAVVAVYRRYPWAMAVHAGLMERGESALRLGHSGLARRAFEDVLAHVTDPRLLSSAKVGNDPSAPGQAGGERDDLAMFIERPGRRVHFVSHPAVGIEATEIGEEDHVRGRREAHPFGELALARTEDEDFSLDAGQQLAVAVGQDGLNAGFGITQSDVDRGRGDGKIVRQPAANVLHRRAEEGVWGAKVKKEDLTPYMPPLDPGTNSTRAMAAA